MAYNGANLSVVAETFNGQTAKLFIYATTDSEAAIEAGGYFSDGFDRGMTLNDIVMAVNTSTHVVKMMVVTNTATVASKAVTVEAAPTANDEEMAITAVTTVGAATLPAAAIVAGVIARGGAQGGSAYTDTTDTAVAIIAALPNPQVLQSWFVLYQNNTNAAATLAAGTGVTLSGQTIVPANQWVLFLATYSAANTVTLAGLAMGQNAQLAPTLYATNTSGTTGTLAAGQMEGAQDCTLAISGGATPTFTTRTAAQLIANVANWQIGDSYRLRIVNTNSGTATLSGGSGVTITGTATMATNTWRDFYVTYTGNGAVGLQSIGTGTTS